MNNTHSSIPESPVASPYSAKDITKPVHFYYANPGARSVNLIGHFNHWDPKTHPMLRQPDGWWFIEVQLSHGHHHYLFLVDGVPTLDPKASGTVWLGPYSKSSVIAVS